MSKNKFNELTRVQMPAMVHLEKLGYKYFGKISESLAGSEYDADTNILTNVFVEQFKKLNPEHEGEAEQTLKLIRQELNNDDLGKSFYKRLTSVSPIRLVDFETPSNNVFHSTAEFTCKNGQDEFRPDITLFVNGLPLVFIEVKKPLNNGGMLEESKRMTLQRFPNKKFRRFINITQLMIFSNNMEYDTEGGIIPIQGAFYCTAARGETKFNCFREENPLNLPIAPYNNSYPYLPVDPAVEKQILTDFNCQVIHTSPEYQTNCNINTPTNRVLTSMCSPERLLFLIKYGIAYVKMEKEVDGKIEVTDQKHIMRYQQMFASLAIIDKLNSGVKSGVVWHTQGSGKTALSYHLTKILQDYYARKNIVSKFYFIVDRLDLLEQSSQEFEARGLEVKTANTRKELMDQFKDPNSLEGDSGKSEIIVVNIQRFAEDKERVVIDNYATNLQRIFIIDEAHRGYNPKGSFLANLFDADVNSVKIALTGTPLLKEERTSWKVFGSYLHTYYYDKSIQDGYTLKIIREDIETSYKEKLSEIYEKLETLVQKKDVKKSDIVEHDTFVKELIRYIINDLNQFRMIQGDNSLGGMVICETSEQARKLYAYFNEIQDEINRTRIPASNLRVGLILHDSDDKETRKQIVKDFKKNMTIDILIVYNMLLTGFDAPRLKRLYFGRKLKDHNLLQAITRVNRPYKNNKYGYVIDFADIKKNFEQTNEAYLRELNRFNDPNEVGEGNEVDTFKQVIEDETELLAQMKQVHEILFNYTIDNLEEFSSEISTNEDKNELLELRKVLVLARDCCNIVRTFGDDELKAKFARFELTRLPEMISEVQRQINTINMKEAFSSDDQTRRLVNEAMQDITFRFSKVDEDEMRLAAGSIDSLEEKWRQAIRAFTENIDPDDPEFITLQEAFMQRFKEHGFVIDTMEEFAEHSKKIDEVIAKLAEIKRKNIRLMKKYNGDAKFARIHKRIKEENAERAKCGRKPLPCSSDTDILDLLSSIKSNIDQKVYDKNDILKKDEFFEQTVMREIKISLDNMSLINERDDRLFIQARVAKQYLDQYRSTYPAA